MNTEKIKTTKHLTIVMAAIATAISVSVNADANEKLQPEEQPSVIYQSKTSGPSIYSYINSLLGEISLKPELIYVSQAYGPAIYSYPHSGTEKVTPWNIEYVNTAYGRAIYSYNNRQPKGIIEVLPLTQ
ncbi:hypothetical protein [Methylomonas sp. MgM2]